MKKLKAFKGFVIAQCTKKEIEQDGKPEYPVYTAEEWAYGEGCRYMEWEASSLAEAEQFINNYKK